MGTTQVPKALTLMDLANQSNNGDLMTVAEVMTKTNEINLDAVWMQANQASAHKTARRSVLPQGDWRQFNKGVGKKKSETIPVLDHIGMLECYSEVDKKLALLSGNVDEFRSNEDLAFVEGLSQQEAEAIFYANMAINPEKFNGLSYRTPYDHIGATCIDAAGTGSTNFSIWLIQWGLTQMSLIYPKGSKTIGIDTENLGQKTLTDADGNQYEGYSTHFSLDMGISIRDDLNVMRIANVKNDLTATNIDTLLLKALNHMKMRGAGAVIYGPEGFLNWVDTAAKDKSNAVYTVKDVFGVETTHFRQHPIRLAQALLETEAEVT